MCYMLAISRLHVAAAPSPGAKRDEVPEHDQRNSADKCSDNGHPVEYRVSGDVDKKDMGRQPDADECSNDCPNEAKGQTPTDNELCYKTNKGCNGDVNDLAECDSNSGIAENVRSTK